MPMLRRLALAALAVLGMSTLAHADVLCASSLGVVKVRPTTPGCKTGETLLDPTALGLQGPPGPQGPPGATTTGEVVSFYVTDNCSATPNHCTNPVFTVPTDRYFVITDIQGGNGSGHLTDDSGTVHFGFIATTTFAGGIRFEPGSNVNITPFSNIAVFIGGKLFPLP
jgi:hypothetical protein